MNARLVLVPAIAALAAAGIWLSRRDPGPIVVPAATWLIGTGPEAAHARNYDDLPADSPVRLALRCDEPRHVYVFSHSAEDGTILLHPSPDVRTDATQPLAAGSATLPGKRDDKELAWTTRRQILATTTFVVIAARQPVPELDALLPKLRRWTNTALTSGAMEVTNPPTGTTPIAGPRTELPDPLLQRAAERSFTATVVNGPLTPDAQREGVWTGSWRVKERGATAPPPPPK